MKSEDIIEFTSLEDILDFKPPPLQNSSSLQLLLINRHLRDSDLPCRSVIVEENYIDRAFVDDYSSFYSTSFKQYDNFCRRIHFFSVEKDKLHEDLTELFELGRKGSGSKSEFSRACEDFSLKSYLGFSVIKPLRGSPIGRTVLRHWGEIADAGFLRKFNCTRQYKVHLFGFEFTVCGLIFQQQDAAVSACATTALWTSLSKLKEFENLRTPTPAQITKLATQHFLPFGRSIPQENGLSVEQMCQAIQALGLSPYLIEITSDLDDTKAYLHSAILSGFAPILIIEKMEKGIPTSEGHAVTATGMKVREKHKKSVIRTKSNNFIDDLAGDLVSVYVNDDRLSPYFRVELQKFSGNLLINSIVADDQGKKILLDEKWKLSHILIPMHAKIRLSFVELREMAISVVNLVGSFMDSFMKLTETTIEKVIQMTSWITKSSDYRSHLFFGKTGLSKEKCNNFNEEINLPRYVGIIRLSHKIFGVIDVLIDTTNIAKNPNFLAVISRTANKEFSEDLVKVISGDLECPFIVDYQKSTTR